MTNQSLFSTFNFQTQFFPDKNRRIKLIVFQIKTIHYHYMKPNLNILRYGCSAPFYSDTITDNILRSLGSGREGNNCFHDILVHTLVKINVNIKFTWILHVTLECCNLCEPFLDMPCELIKFIRRSAFFSFSPETLGQFQPSFAQNNIRLRPRFFNQGKIITKKWKWIDEILIKVETMHLCNFSLWKRLVVICWHK